VKEWDATNGTFVAAAPVADGALAAAFFADDLPVRSRPALIT
jgi:hypothetical protein